MRKLLAGQALAIKQPGTLNERGPSFAEMDVGALN